MAKNYADHTAKSDAQAPADLDPAAPGSAQSAQSHFLPLVRLLARAAARDALEAHSAAHSNSGHASLPTAPGASEKAV